MVAKTCPQCEQPVPSSPGYPDWCECGWNLEAPARRSFREGRFAALLARRSGRRVPRSGRVLAYAIAVGVLALDLALLAAGIALIVVPFPNLLTILFGATLISLGVVMRPRIPRLEDGLLPLEPQRAPTLHALVKQVADAEQLPPPDVIAIDIDWNAAWTMVGLRRRRVLMIGLPLFACLEAQQRVALIAHEVGHERSGDPTRGLVLGSAVGALDRLSHVFNPPETQFDFGPIEWVTRPLTWLASRPVDAVLWLQARLLLRDMQHSEYRADARAAAVAGAPAVIALHEQLLQHPTFDHVVRRAATGPGGEDVITGLRDTLRSVPERERERRRRVARLERTRLTDTHPPTALRIAALEALPPRAAAVTLAPTTAERIDRELEALEAEIGRALVDRYRNALYYG